MTAVRLLLAACLMLALSTVHGCPSGTTEGTVSERSCTCEPRPEDMSLGSLVFVIDTTGSMGTVIQAVKNSINDILTANKRFSNYVIATFGDPYVKYLKKTTNAAEVTAFLNTLRADGGGDCPEFAMSGAKDAAEVADPNSVMMLFTDASAKDASISASVAAVLKEKRIRFYGILSGTLCGAGNGKYDELAKASLGQLAELNSDASNKLMEFIKKAVAGKLSFSAFPANAAALDSALRGECGCRIVTRRVCEKAACPAGTREAFVPERTCACEPRPEDKNLGSLVFVIDTTGSMGTVIQAVKNSINDILTANKRFQNYVIATFGDPYLKNLKKTTVASEVIGFLNTLRAMGGGDCPEFAMSGAIDAADAAEPNSVMLLFTDASAKDPHLSPTLIAKLREKRIRFFGVLSGSLCDEGNAKYDALAKASEGQIGSLSMDASNKLMEFIKQAVAGKLSFSAFPTNAVALDAALRGECACRNVNRRICENVPTTVPPTTPRPTTLILPGLKALGCFVDSGDRDLPVLAESGTMTVARCYGLCRARGSAYFGVQWARECWCGNSYGKHGGSRPASECTMKCTGDNSATCGDNWRNNVYETGLSPPTAPPTTPKTTPPTTTPKPLPSPTTPKPTPPPTTPSTAATAASSSRCPAGKREATVTEKSCTCEPKPEDKSLGSLIFVIDTTGSMGGVINAVRNSIKDILAANTRFSNYVIATFGDPYVKYLLKTTKAAEVTAFLNTLRADGGGDCPEFAMSGAKDAAEVADPNSVMMLFTDASAKDASISASVAAKLTEKRIRFFGVLSGTLCGAGNAKYDELAKASFGALGTLNTDASNKLMDFIKQAVAGKLSFSAFPANSAALDAALRGECGCRFVTRWTCV